MPGPNQHDNSKRALPLIANNGDASCTTCTSNVYIWDEEVELVRAMNAVKMEVRAAHASGLQDRIAALREQFETLRSRMEKVRRRRLDSLGHVDYD